MVLAQLETKPAVYHAAEKASGRQVDRDRIARGNRRCREEEIRPAVRPASS
jgi:hypothetical protein